MRNLRSPLLAVILLFAVLLLVAAPLLIRRSILPQPVADDNRLVEYNNPTLGFKLQRPEPWTVVEDHPQLIAPGQDMLHGVAFVPNPDEQKALVMVYVQTLTDTLTLQAYAAKQRADLETNAQVTSSELKPLTINGQAALETGATTSVSGEPLQYRLIMLINGQRAYALLYTGPKGGASSERFQSMLDSFEFVR